MLLGGENTDELRGKIKELAEAGNGKLLINLGRTTHMTAGGMSVLVACHINYVKRDAKMKLCAVNKRIQELLVLTQLSSVLDVYGTEEEALESFN